MREFSFAAPRQTHPVTLAAAASVITFSLLGIGAITGLIPSAYSKSADDGPQSRVAAERTMQDSSRRPVSPAFCPNCGVVDAIRVVHVDGNASGVGAVAGGVTGAVVGHQMGNGQGRDVMTVLGGIGGAFAGNSIEKTINRHAVYRVTVRMEDGSFRTVSQASPPSIEVGGRVRISNGSLVAQS